jgi:TonB family protein
VLADLKPGRVYVGTSVETGKIIDLGLPAAPRGLARALAYDAGMALYKGGDPQGALDAWLPLARAGFPPASYSIADLYYRGDGIERRLDESIRWFRESAERLYPPAMFHLGFLHVQGEGVERDLVEAYRWMARAAQFGDHRGSKGAELLAARMTPEQLAAAKQSLDSDEISNPVLLEKTALVYPELARVARLEGVVILMAQIYEDGSVGEAEILEVNRPNLGFEEAAIDALCKWRYDPARRGNAPIEVYFTVFVEFKLH